MMLLVLAALGSGIALGLIEGFISQWFNLLIIFPMLLGLGVGFAVTFVVEKKHVRAPVLATALAVLGAGLAHTAVHVAQYENFRSAALTAMRDEARVKGIDSAQVNDELLDAVLERDTGSSGFMGYLKVASEQGTEVKRFGQSSGGLKMSGPLYWIMVLVDFAIAIGGAAYLAWSASTEPYCEGCERWYDAVESFPSGSGDKAAVSATIDALERGSYAEVPQALGYPTAKAASTLQLKRCRGCPTHEPMVIYTVITDGGKKQSEKWRSMLTPDDAKLLTAALTQKKA